MKKKLVMLLVSLCAAATITGCGGKGASNQYIKISEYKGIEVEKAKPSEVTDEDVEAKILADRRAQSGGTLKEVTDRAAKEGDMVTIDYVGKIDGEEFEGGSAQDQMLTIGEGGYVDGFEDGIVGHNAGETFDVALTFPDNYGEHSNADVVFTMTLDKIEEEVLPELNDEFVKTVSETATTVDEYKKEVKEALAETNEANSEAENDVNIWNAVLKNAKVVSYPKEELEEGIEQSKAQMEQLIPTYFGMSMEEYLKQSGLTEETYDEQIESTVKDMLKEEMAIELIAEKEKLKPSDEEMKKKKEELMSMYGFEDVASMEEQVGKDTVEDMILSEVVKEWVAEHAKLVEKK